MNEELEDLLERWPMGSQFNLNEDSLIVVVGAYKGITMELLHELYHPRFIIGYEPQHWAAAEARARLYPYPRCVVVNYGLGLQDATLPMGEWGTDACSFVNTGSREKGVGSVVDANKALNSFHVGHFDLMVMNVEGYEFYLLPYLSKTGWLERINSLAVQFHLGLGNDDTYDEIIHGLNTHYPSCDSAELPTWGLWQRCPF